MKVIRLIFIVILLFQLKLFSIAPEYITFGRDQKINHNYHKNDLLRIWIVYVGQGDGILIQLPDKYNYDSDSYDSSSDKSEKIDILIDGGSFYGTNTKKMLNFINSLYSFSDTTIEHSIITHHDSDHIQGLINILKEPTISLGYIYHNGLASYKPKPEYIGDINSISNAIMKYKNGEINRFMSFYNPETNILKSAYFIKDLNDLRLKYFKKDFQGLYDSLSNSIIEKSEPESVISFKRVWRGESFINEIEASTREELSGISFDLIWPSKDAFQYKKDWGKTINGNSLTFRIKYGDFEMLFTGDLNKPSELALIDHLSNIDQTDLLNCDVLKIPHHGSNHNLEHFIISNGSHPVITVASLGAKGFNKSWKHPSPKIIQWAGGAHRFYSTYIHEKKFKWENLVTKAKKDSMIEIKHILIETDGKWFRLVEVDPGTSNLNIPPSVQQTRRGNGTRWVKSK